MAEADGGEVRTVAINTAQSVRMLVGDFAVKAIMNDECFGLGGAQHFDHGELIPCDTIAMPRFEIVANALGDLVT